jgi:hypothetical protein
MKLFQNNPIVLLIKSFLLVISKYTNSMTREKSLLNNKKTLFFV